MASTQNIEIHFTERLKEALEVHMTEHELASEKLNELEQALRIQDKLACIRAKELAAAKKSIRDLDYRIDMLEKAIMVLAKKD